MFNEGKHAFGHFIELICDTKSKRHKETRAYIATSTREQCNQLLFQMGWRLYRKKQLCPTCALRVSKRIARKHDAIRIQEAESAISIKREIEQ